MPASGDSRAGVARALQVLTKSEEKRALYVEDAYFRDAWADCVELFGDDALTMLHTIALLVVMPEAVVSGRATAVLDFLDEHGFCVRWSSIYAFDRLAIREVWRYQINNATLDRVRLVDRLNAAGASVALLCADGMSRELPAAVQASELKGPSDPAARKPHHLRTRLGCDSKMLTCVHCADEPADVVRELGVMFDRPSRIEALRACSANRSGELVAREQVEQVSSMSARHSLQLDEAVDNIKQIASQVPSSDDVNTVLKLCEELRDARSSDWPQLWSLAERAQLPVSLWDLLVIGAETTTTHLPDVQCLIPPSVRSGWTGDSTTPTRQI